MADVFPIAGLPIEDAFAADGPVTDWPARGVFGFDSRDIRSRPFNLLRSQVLKVMRANGWRVLGVTSATPDVGKSFVASNLAAAMARLPGMRTVLCDLDFRRHSVAAIFGVDAGRGIEAYLAGDAATPDAVTYPIGRTGLSVIPSFWTGGSSSEVLAGQRLGTLFQTIRAAPDDVLCICDLPPAFANDDAAIAARQIDAYLLVVEEGTTTRRHIQDTIAMLDPAPCIGTVLNRYHGGLGVSDYGFGYGTDGVYADYYR